MTYVTWETALMYSIISKEFDAWDERLKFNVRSSQGGCWNLADRGGFGQNRQIEITVNGRNWGKPLAWDSSIRHNNGGNSSWIMGGGPQNPKVYQILKFIQIFWISLDWPITVSLTNLQVKIQMCDWGQILGCRFKEKGGDVGEFGMPVLGSRYNSTSPF